MFKSQLTMRGVEGNEKSGTIVEGWIDKITTAFDYLLAK